MTGREDSELADSVLEVSISANREIVDELIGDESMYETLMEIMEPKLRIREEKVRIKEAIDLLRDIQQTDQEIKKVIIKRYNLTEDEAEEYICSAV
ncbi:MAG: hypothetical protein NC541_09390 [bacterium]|nr:hypothetical protein [bacterium]